ncbi:hypothetical protein ACHAXT_007518 [Thalassiosira profunda]
MKESVPSDDAIAKLEKAVKSARVKLALAKSHLTEEYEIDTPPQNHIRLALSIVPNKKEDEHYLMAADILRGELGEALEALEVAREQRRVDAVVRAREEEISFGKNVDDCPICLDPLYAGITHRLFVGALPCCGKQICVSCADDHVEKIQEEFTKTKPYYQYVTGKDYFTGGRGGINRSNDRKALQYMKMAAKGGEAEAQALLGLFYHQSPRGIVERSTTDALYWYETAASNGHVFSHMSYAMALIKEWIKSPDTENHQVYPMTAFAAHHGILQAQSHLSDYYSYFQPDFDVVTKKSFIRAKYWLGKVLRSPQSEVVEQGQANAYGRYASILLALQDENMNGVSDVAGHSSVPEALYWFRKAKEVNSVTPQDEKLMEQCELVGTFRCHCCKTSSEKYKLAGQGNMMKCRRCHWARYCSKQCQVRHWEMGHKKDCKKKY